MSFPEAQSSGSEARLGLEGREACPLPSEAQLHPQASRRSPINATKGLLCAWGPGQQTQGPSTIFTPGGSQRAVALPLSVPRPVWPSLVAPVPPWALGVQVPVSPTGWPVRLSG